MARSQPDLSSDAAAFAGAWLWWLPATYAAHALEEVWAGEGYGAWVQRFGGGSIDDGRLLALHLLLLGGLCINVWLVLRVDRLYWSIVGVAFVYIGNAFFHVVTSVTSSSYSPGLFTGLVLWLPLGGLVVARAGRSLPRSDLWWGALIGVLGTVLVSVLALNPEWIPLP